MRALLGQPRQLLTAVAAVAAALLIGFELKAVVATALLATAEPDTPQRATATADPVADIIAAGLFGAPAQTTSGDEMLPQSSAALILRGVFTGQTPEQGSAILELPDGSTRVARVGDSLGDGAVLERIYPDRVVLNRNGLQEYLSFPSAEAYGGATSTMATVQPVSGEAPAAALSEEEKRNNILRRLEELRARSLERTQG
jgi:type II secretory pathway component PulC